MTWQAWIVVTAVGLYILGGIAFFFYVFWNDQRRRRLTTVRLFLLLGASPIGMLVCIAIWPFLWMAYPDEDAPGRQFTYPDDVVARRPSSLTFLLILLILVLIAVLFRHR
jgi:hypothetical protein